MECVDLELVYGYTRPLEEGKILNSILSKANEKLPYKIWLTQLPPAVVANPFEERVM